ncbi:hypothetical protein [Maridesulfovibrio sp.]|uniref:hypothetical protein n=1 Tax=Maridesulfovibrio sp. TaxID=2795000 RepID=UPI0029CA0476|nr:hypothetical protein [Maridesulfovibrio sp.]
MTDSYIIEVANCGSSNQTVNLKTISCTCMDWKTRRAQQPQNSPIRLCKHLIAAICEYGLEGEYPEEDLQALYKKKKGFPFPKATLSTLAKEYFNADLTEEDEKRLHFLFGDKNAFSAFSTFQKLTEKGETAFRSSENKTIHQACQRLAWFGAAECCKDKPAKDLLEALELSELKGLGSALGENFAQKKKGIATLSEHPDLNSAFTEAGFKKEDFFILKPLNLDMLR